MILSETREEHVWGYNFVVCKKLSSLLHVLFSRKANLQIALKTSIKLLFKLETCLPMTSVDVCYFCTALAAHVKISRAINLYHLNWRLPLLFGSL